MSRKQNKTKSRKRQQRPGTERAQVVFSVTGGVGSIEVRTPVPGLMIEFREYDEGEDRGDDGECVRDEDGNWYLPEFIRGDRRSREQVKR